MTSREPPNPAAHRLAAVINDGGRDAFPATLTPDTTLTDDGNPQSLREGLDRPRDLLHARSHECRA
ncbi:MAG TPA: hypothetical protein VGL63_10700 [Streptosporangiaceae bacterium]|jgi:hypothetical protein